MVMMPYLRTPERRRGSFHPNHVLFAVAREQISHFLQNRKLCRDLRKQSSECWQLQSRCDVCHGALLTGGAASLAPPRQLVIPSPLKEAAGHLTPPLSSPQSAPVSESCTWSWTRSLSCWMCLKTSMTRSCPLSSTTLTKLSTGSATWRPSSAGWGRFWATAARRQRASSSSPR